MKIVTFVCLAAVLLLPGVLFAQSTEQPTVPSLLTQPSNAAQAASAEEAQVPVPASPVHEPSGHTASGLRIPIAMWAASVTADQTTTYLFSSRYQGVLHEKNFLIRGLDQHPVALVAAGTAIDVATGVIAYRLLRNHPRLAKVVFLGAAAYRTYLAAYNIRMMRRADALLAAANVPAVR